MAFGVICGVDLTGGQSGGGKRDNRSGRGRSRWSNLYAAIYFYSMVRVTVVSYCQYNYDFSMQRCSRLNCFNVSIDELLWDTETIKAFNDNKQNLSNRGNENDQLKATVMEQTIYWRNLLFDLGAPYIYCRFAAGCIFLFVVLLSLLLYVQPQFYYNRMNPFDFSLIRTFLEPESEFANIEMLAQREVDRFILSSRTFVLTCIKQNQLDVADGGTAIDSLILTRLVFEHNLIVRQIKQMVQSGTLKSCNRSQESIKRFGNFYFILCVVSIIWAVGTTSSFTSALLTSAGVTIRLGLMDLLTLFEVHIIALFIAVAGTFYSSLTFIVCADQIFTARSLRCSINKCLKGNTNLFEHRRAILRQSNVCDETDSRNLLLVSKALNKRQMRPRARLQARQIAKLELDRYRTQMNGQLLEVFIRYKLFLAQMRPTRRSYTMIANISVVVLLLMPAVGRIHMPYMQDSFKLGALFVSLTAAIIADMSLLPICYLHSRCSELYKSLTGLMAHLIAVGSQESRLYDSHLASSFKRELDYPDLATNLFTTKVLGFSFDYSNFLRVHFWFNIINISIMIETNQQNSAVAGFFNDPLGLLH